MAERLKKYVFDELQPEKVSSMLEERFMLSDRVRIFACNKDRRVGFYKNVIKLMAPVLLTWMLVQGVAAAKGEHTSRWVGMLAVGLSSLVFAVMWYFVIDSRCKSFFS